MGGFSIFMVFKKAPFGRTFPLKSLLFVTRRSQAGRPCRDPAFHETIRIIVPLGPSVSKRHFFYEDLLMFYLLCISLAMFYMPS